MNFGSFGTINKYIRFLHEVYLLFDLSIFDYSVKKQMVNLNKIYCIDNGFFEAISFKFSENYGRLLENLVFIELKRQGKEIYYHRKKKECDFIIKKGLDIVEAIQVTQSLENEDRGAETKKREIEGLLDACKSYNLNNGLILTDDEEDEFIQDDIRIKVKPIWKWLLT